MIKKHGLFTYSYDYNGRDISVRAMSKNQAKRKILADVMEIENEEIMKRRRERQARLDRRRFLSTVRNDAQAGKCRIEIEPAVGILITDGEETKIWRYRVIAAYHTGERCVVDICRNRYDAELCRGSLLRGISAYENVV